MLAQDKGCDTFGDKMARIRTIKPEFWTDPALMECSLSARLLFIGILNFADDEGNIEAHEKMIKVQVFPGDSIKIGPLIKSLIKQNLLIPYVVNERNYYHIRGFKKHQLINRPSAPKCPLYEYSLRTPEVLTPEGKGREGIGGDSKGGDSKSIYGEFKNVKLSEDEHKKLIERFGVKGTEEWIKKLDGYVASTGKKYKSHYHTILTWADKEKKEGKPQKGVPLEGKDYTVGTEDF